MAKGLDIYLKCVPKLRNASKKPKKKIINHVRQEQQSPHQTYNPMHYGHAQALLLGPPPAYSYEPLAMYHPMQNQWRQNQSQQSNVQSAQPKDLVVNNNPQNS